MSGVRAMLRRQRPEVPQWTPSENTDLPPSRWALQLLWSPFPAFQPVSGPLVAFPGPVKDNGP
jgi:hypothetical protein